MKHLDQMDLIDIFEAFHQNQGRICFLLKCTETIRQDRPHLGPRLNKFKKIEIISSIFSDDSAMRLDINCRGKKTAKKH